MLEVLIFFFEDKMTIGVIKEELIVRVINDKMSEEHEKTNVRPMDFTKKTTKEFVYVSQNGVKTEIELLHYI